MLTAGQWGEAERGLDEIDRQGAHERMKEQLRALDFQREVPSQERGVEIDVSRL